MKQFFLITLIWITSVSVSFSQSGKPFLVDTWTDSVSRVIDDKEYTIQYVVKKYDVGRYVTLDNQEPDHSNPTYCLWTVSVPAQNFEAMLKIGAIKFTDIRDNDGSRRGQIADNLTVSWYAAPSIINSKEFELASFKNCLLYYKASLSTDEDLAGTSKTDITENQNLSIFDISAYEIQETTEQYNTETGTFTDSRDNKAYKWVKIGSQIWMAQNLNYNIAGSGCNQCETYGRLYTWDAANRACPSSWHLPSDSEWQTLIDYLGGSGVAGGKMKSTGTWQSPNTDATNSSGFSALPGGFRLANGSFYNAGNGGWWSSRPTAVSLRTTASSTTDTTTSAVSTPSVRQVLVFAA